MSYKSDLEKSNTFDEVQMSYEKAIGEIAKKNMSQAIAKDFDYWLKAQQRLVELFPDLANSYDPGDQIQSKY